PQSSSVRSRSGCQGARASEAFQWGINPICARGLPRLVGVVIFSSAGLLEKGTGLATTSSSHGKEATMHNIGIAKRAGSAAAIILGLVALVIAANDRATAAAGEAV